MSSKLPCTKKAYEKFIKDSGWCVAMAHKDATADGCFPDCSMEDILCDSVDNFLMDAESDIVWYVVNRLEVAQPYAKDSLYDQIYSEALKHR